MGERGREQGERGEIKRERERGRQGERGEIERRRERGGDRVREKRGERGRRKEMEMGGLERGNRKQSRKLNTILLKVTGKYVKF